MKQIPTINKLKKGLGIDPQILGTELTEYINIIINNLQEPLGVERKKVVELKSTMDHSISNLYRLVWGQFTPALK